jgi:SAM-dependent methyltransferase
MHHSTNQPSSGNIFIRSRKQGQIVIDSLLRQHLEGFHANHVLDVGPGYNAFGRIAARATGAGSVTYIDCNRDVLAWQSAECRKEGFLAECLLFPLEPAALRSLSGHYDLILCQEVLEHLANAEEVLARLVEHLSPGGRIVITVPTKRSEQWLKRINPNYMKNDPHGHVREFDEAGLRELIQGAGLRPMVFLPTQAHFFVAHTWFFGTRMRIEESTGKILTKGIRGFAARKLFKLTKMLFRITGYERWNRLLPRNYFVVAKKRG